MYANIYDTLFSHCTVCWKKTRTGHFSSDNHFLEQAASSRTDTYNYFVHDVDDA